MEVQQIVFSQHAVGKTPDVEVNTVFNYTPADPVAVKFEFPGQHGEEWYFARSLLTDVLANGTSGLHDVKFTTEGANIRMLLLGQVTVTFERVDIESFYEQTLMMIPLDEENVDLASDFDKWFGETV